MKTIAEEVLCKHKVEQASISRLAIDNAIETENIGELVDVYDFTAPTTPEQRYLKIATKYIYDDDSYTIINVNGQHTTGINMEVDEYTLINTDYLTVRQRVSHERESEVREDSEIQPQGRSPAKDPILRHVETQNTAMLKLAKKWYERSIAKQTKDELIKTAIRQLNEDIDYAYCDDDIEQCENELINLQTA